MTLAQFVSNWLPNFRRTSKGAATRRAELVRRRMEAVERHQSRRDIDAELQAQTHAQLRAEIGMGR